MLSIIYDNFEEVIEILQTGKFVDAINIYHLIERYRDVVTRDCSELIGYWMSTIIGVKSTRKRIRATKIVLGKKKADRMQLVLEAYYQIKTDERKEMSKHKITTTLQKKLCKIYQETPSLSTIKRYLEEENLI